MLDLITRLEKATGPDRELDVLIADIVLDLEWRPYREGARKLWGFRRGTDKVEVFGAQSVKEYTRLIDAALTLVPEGWSRSMSGPDYNHLTGKTDSYFAYVREQRDIYSAPPDAEGYARHSVQAIALCIAVLKARAAITGGKGSET